MTGLDAELQAVLPELELRLGPLRSPPDPLNGGITNRNFRARFGSGDYVVRLPGRDTHLLGIDREAERLATVAAGELGIGPRLAYADARCVVIAFLDGATTVDPDALRADPGVIGRALRTFHDCGLQLPVRFWIPDQLADYAALLESRGATIPPAFRRAQRLVVRIAEVLPLADPVPCHNDLLPGNLVGTAAGVKLVDWEYAGMGHRYFDLGNLATNNGFDAAAELRLLEAYFGVPAPPSRQSALRLFRIVSDAREAAWGVLQGAISALDFDFESYAASHYERLEAAANAPEFEKELRNAEA